MGDVILTHLPQLVFVVHIWIHIFVRGINARLNHSFEFRLWQTNLGLFLRVTLNLTTKFREGTAV